MMSVYPEPIEDMGNSKCYAITVHALRRKVLRFCGQTEMVRMEEAKKNTSAYSAEVFTYWRDVFTKRTRFNEEIKSLLIKNALSAPKIHSIAK
jgi:hypothetical protein